MNPLNTLQAITPAAGQYLSEQAQPGLSAPSQDTDPAAQLPRESQDAERGAESVLARGAAAGETLQPEPDRQGRR